MRGNACESSVSELEPESFPVGSQRTGLKLINDRKETSMVRLTGYGPIFLYHLLIIQIIINNNNDNTKVNTSVQLLLPGPLRFFFVYRCFL
jgi:hypothetical protein